MAKKDYSKYIEDSLKGRLNAPTPLSDDNNPTDSHEPTTRNTEKAVETVDDSMQELMKVNPIDDEKPKTKKSNAGRKKMDVRKKKKQMVLTLSPDAYNRLIEWADTKPRSAPNYVSEFVEEHLDDIMK